PPHTASWKRTAVLYNVPVPFHRPFHRTRVQGGVFFCTSRVVGRSSFNLRRPPCWKRKPRTCRFLLYVDHIRLLDIFLQLAHFPAERSASLLLPFSLLMSRYETKPPIQHLCNGRHALSASSSLPPLTPGQVNAKIGVMNT
ncbi:unnamed protein product, partial [Ectocarpus sp. 8 AP-2014]